MVDTAFDRASLHERVAALEHTLSNSEQAVARFLAEHPDVVATTSAVELGTHTGTSNATVIRTIKSLGYDGLLDLKQTLLKVMVERLNPAAALGHEIERLDTGGTVADQVLLATADLLHQARKLVEGEKWERAVEIVEAADGVLCYGIEQAGCVADFLTIELARCGKRSRSMTATGIAIANGLLSLTSDDAVIVIAPLRHFREIDVVVNHAYSLGAPVILVSEALGMALEDRVDVTLPTPQTTLGLTSEILAPMTLARALVLEIASRHREQAVKTYDMVNRFRFDTVGAELDVQPLTIDHTPPPAPKKRTRRRRK